MKIALQITYSAFVLCVEMMLDQKYTDLSSGQYYILYSSSINKHHSNFVFCILYFAFCSNNFMQHNNARIANNYFWLPLTIITPCPIYIAQAQATHAGAIISVKPLMVPQME